MNAYTSLAAARAWFDKAFESARTLVATRSDADLMASMPAGAIMGGAPRMAIFSAITDHTAHHRRALTVYARLQGLVPPMPSQSLLPAFGGRDAVRSPQGIQVASRAASWSYNTNPDPQRHDRPQRHSHAARQSSA